MAAAAVEKAHRFAWPSVAAQVMEAYEEAIAIPRARGRACSGRRSGSVFRAADLKPHVGPAASRASSPGRRPSVEAGRFRSAAGLAWPESPWAARLWECLACRRSG